MKPSTQNSFPLARRSLIAASFAVLLGGATAVAQSGAGSGGAGSGGSGGAGSSNYGSPTSGTSGSTSTTGTSASENARRNSQGGATGSSGTYGTSGSSTGTSGTSSTDATGSSRGTSGSTYSSSSDTSGSSSGKLGWGDRRFVSKAADSGMTELQMAQLAAERATNPEVKAFAQKLITDHQKVNSELTSIAGQKNVKLDSDDGKDRHYNRLSKKSGSEFDQEFVEHMVEMHENDVKLFEKAASDAKDTELRSFASKHVGHLREHLQQAQSLRQTIMPTGRMEESSSSRASGSSGTSGTSGTSGSTSTSGENTRSQSSGFGTGTSGTSSSGSSLGTGTSGSSGSSGTSGSGTSGSGTGTSGSSSTRGSGSR